jgi:RNA polymerase sigma-70 factor (ECF subfamily)
LGEGSDEEFRKFVEEAEPRLRRALTARFGNESGRDAIADALAWAYEHWDRVEAMSNPIGYLYRVGQSTTRKRRVRPVFERPPEDEVWVEPQLLPAVAALPDRERVAVLLVCVAGWSQSEVAALLGTRKTTVQSRVERGLRRLRRELGVEIDE